MKAILLYRINAIAMLNALSTIANVIHVKIQFEKSIIGIRRTSITTTKKKSAIESRVAPKGVAILNLRAIGPSSISETIATRYTIVNGSVNGRSNINGIKQVKRNIDNALGTYFILVTSF